MSLKKKLTLSQQIFLSMIALISFSFLIVAVLNIIQIQNETKTYNIDRLSRKDRAVAKSIEAIINLHSKYNVDLQTAFKPILQDVGHIHKLTINIYNLNGRFIWSSDSLLLNDSVITKAIPNNLIKLCLNSTDRKIEYEKGKYFGTYRVLYKSNNTEGLTSSTPIITDSPYCILDVVYDKSTKQDILLKTNQQIKGFIKIYIILLLVTVVFAYFLLKQITSPLRSIARHLSIAKIDKNNTPLKWTVQDEIGQLIQEYNNLMRELEKRTKELVKSEKEGAWKKMAKQIAHEIKNPLTPMRLSMQHITSTLNKEDINFENKLKDFSKTMIQQIDTLATIASSFSDFANLNKQNSEDVLIKQEIISIINLFKSHNVLFDGSNQNSQIDSLLIEIDKSHLTRVINNLINNSLQAQRKGVPIEVRLNVFLESKNSTKYCAVTISDNGKGIPNEIQNKIFEPNFTTKNSGMGLGLAMVKKIVDDMGGIIEYKTKLGKGTVFYVYFPLNQKN
tara:strand:- start:223 stop:1737 length:1515 start_codon:yes stop_codon:yes gene_type:complete